MARDKQITANDFYRQRFYNLMIKKRRGTATFKELTELDAILNHDPVIKEKILDVVCEFEISQTKNTKEINQAVKEQNRQKPDLWQRIKQPIADLLLAKNQDATNN
jgi:competence protein ComGF